MKRIITSRNNIIIIIIIYRIIGKFNKVKNQVKCFADIVASFNLWLISFYEKQRKTRLKRVHRRKASLSISFVKKKVYTTMLVLIKGKNYK